MTWMLFIFQSKNTHLGGSAFNPNTIHQRVFEDNGGKYWWGKYKRKIGMTKVHFAFNISNIQVVFWGAQCVQWSGKQWVINSQDRKQLFKTKIPNTSFQLLLK